MPTVVAGDFRKGVIFEMDGKPMVVVDFQHVKPGKGAAFVRTKYRNVMTGAVREEAFNPTAKFEQGAVERRDAEYSYNDGDLYYFMDPETYDMVPLNADVLGDAFKFVKENTMCKLLSYKGSVFTVEAGEGNRINRVISFRGGTDCRRSLLAFCAVSAGGQFLFRTKYHTLQTKYP